VVYEPYSPTAEPDDAKSPGAADGDRTDPAAGSAEEAAESLDLPAGSRNALITTMRDQVLAYVDTIAGLAGETATAWNDGIEVDDIRHLGARWGAEMTDYAVKAFEAAIDSMRPASETADRGEDADG